MTPTSAKLKYDIDRGRGGDKVDVLDLAAAPLGTDDEAAGTPPTPEELRLAHKNEIASAPVSSERRGDHSLTIYLSVVVIAVLAVASAVAFL